MAVFKIAVDAPGGTGRIELSNAKFEVLRLDSSDLNGMDFGTCDEQNIRFNGGRHMHFSATIEPTSREWFVRLYGERGKCFMWFKHNGTRYSRNYSDGESSKYNFRGRSADSVISDSELLSVDVESVSG